MIQDVYVTQDDGKRKRIGYVSDKVFYATRKRSKHFYKKLNAWGLDHAVLERLMLDYGVDEIVIYDTENGKRYKTPINAFNTKGQYLNHIPYGKQQFLAEEYWEVV